MDADTARAILDLATTGRLSTDSAEVVAAALGVTEGDTDTKAAKAAAKGSAR